MFSREVAPAAIWRRMATAVLALALALAPVAARPEDEKPNKIERAAKKTGQAIENTADRAGKWAGRTVNRAGKFIENTAQKTDKAIRRALE
jgi:hypothetical protein